MRAKWRLIAENEGTNDGVRRRTSGMNMPGGGMVMQVEIWTKSDGVVVALTYVPNSTMTEGSGDGTNLEKM